MIFGDNPAIDYSANYNKGVPAQTYLSNQYTLNGNSWDFVKSQLPKYGLENMLKLENDIGKFVKDNYKEDSDFISKEKIQNVTFYSIMQNFINVTTGYMQIIGSEADIPGGHSLYCNSDHVNSYGANRISQLLEDTVFDLAKKLC